MERAPTSAGGSTAKTGTERAPETSLMKNATLHGKRRDLTRPSKDFVVRIANV